MDVRLIQLDDGGEIWTIIDEYACPLPWPSLFATAELYKDNHAANTMKAHLYELRFFLKWAESKPIDVEHRIACGNWLRCDEINQFADAALLRAKDALRDITNTVPFSSTISDKVVSNAIFNSETIDERVAPSTTNSRFATAARYIEFLVAEMHQDNLSEESEWAAERMSRLINKEMLTISSKSKLGDKYDGINSVMPAMYFNRLINIVQIDSDDNPFSLDTGIRERNMLIVELAMALGNRRGAIAKLKLSDLDLPSSSIKITRSPKDPSDTRRNRPQHKTQEHTSYISPRLQAQLLHYIDGARANTPNAENHEFLFVTHTDTMGTLGQPISLSSINRVFSILSEHLGFRVTAHILRHKWNELFSERCELKGIDRHKADKMRKYVMGWCTNSSSPERYNQYKDMQEACAIQLDVQELLFSARYDNDIVF